jgi:hypothetical protein
MNKLLTILVAALGVALLGATGCSKKVEIGTEQFEATFAEAEGEVKTNAVQVVELIMAEDHAGALEKLQAMFDSGDLGPLQETEVMTLMEELKPLVQSE